jgi:phosphoglycerate dehydrogenase-like enzyme
MKVLFIGFADLVHPWYDDFLEAIDGKHSVELYDPSSPLIPQFQDVQVVVDQGGWGSREMVDAAVTSGVKLWQVIGTGLNHLDVKHILERKLPLANTPGVYSGIALAEHVLFLMLCFAKNLDVSRNNIRSGIFYHPMNEELYGRTLGLIGFGGSSRALAARAWPMGMRILAIDVLDVSRAVQAEYHLDFFGNTADLGKLLRESDYLSVHIPLTAKTQKLIHQESFRQMKPSAVLINAARGEIVDEVALIDALRAGKIRGAGLDVFSNEPLDSDHPLLHMENVIATPHLAGGTRGTSRRRGKAAAENVFCIAEGQSPLHLVTSYDT